MAKTLYDVLEVSQNASPETITSTYQRLHSKLMEGVDGASADEDTLNRLTALREAHSILSDPERRRRYDLRLNARQDQVVIEEDRPRTFLKLLIAAALIGAFGIGYAKYQTEQEKARLERERIAAEAKMAELKAQQDREEKLAAEQADRQRLQEAAIERFNRERDIAHGEQVSMDLRRAEQQAQRDQQREEQQRLAAERQQRYEAERQLAKDKAYLRQLEAENRQYKRMF